MIQGKAKLVGFDYGIDIKFEVSISNLGFGIDSGLCGIPCVRILDKPSIGFGIGIDLDLSQILILISSWIRF